MEGNINRPASKPGDPSETFEHSLSPEVVERVMRKVQDINKLGTVYSAIFNRSSIGQNLSKLPSIFSSGLLGADPSKGDSGQDVTKERWATEARNHTARVYFNILGTGALHQRDGGRPDRMDNVPVLGTLGIIFDSSDFEEEFFEDFPEQTSRSESQSQTSRKFRSSDLYGRSRPGKVGYDRGFNLSYRVSPRLFRGVMFKVADETDPKILENKASEIAEIMQTVHKTHPELLIPIYDIHGNLWWPKQMTYEEVKRYVGEREEGKKL